MTTDTTKTRLVIFRPEDALGGNHHILKSQSQTKDLGKWMERKGRELPVGTRVYAYAGNSVLHYQLRDRGYWELERQVIR